MLCSFPTLAARQSPDAVACCRKQLLQCTHCSLCHDAVNLHCHAGAASFLEAGHSHDATACCRQQLLECRHSLLHRNQHGQAGLPCCCCCCFLLLLLPLAQQLLQFHHCSLRQNTVSVHHYGGDASLDWSPDAVPCWAATACCQCTAM